MKFIHLKPNYLILALALLCSSCNIFTKKEIIPESKVVSPWEGFKTVIFESTKTEIGAPPKQFALSIFQDNSISFINLMFRLAYSHTLSKMTNKRAYLTTVPILLRPYRGIDYSENPEDYLLVAIFVNRAGDFQTYYGCGGWAEVDNFEEAETEMVECLTGQPYQFSAGAIFKEGIK